MAGKVESGRKKLLDKIKFEVLYLTIQAKISLLGASFLTGKSLKGLLPFFMGLLLLASPGILPAQTPDWPWVFGESLQMTTDADDNFSPAVVSNNQLYFAVWYRNTPSGYKIYGARIDQQGKVFEDDKGGVPICTGQGDQMFPSISWNGENFFVVWQDRRSGKRWDIYGARIAIFSRFLSILDPQGIPVSVGKSGLDQVSPSLAFDGENQLVVWRAKRSAKAWDIVCKFVKASNEELVPNPVTIQVSASLKDQSSPSVVFNPDSGNYFIVWQDKRNGTSWDIYGGRIARDGTPLDPGDIQISSNGFDQWSPTLSWNGKYYLVAWTAAPQGSNGYIISGRMFDSEGHPMNYEDIQLQGDGKSKAFPAILADGEQELLVWEEGPGDNPTISAALIVPGYRIFTGVAMQVSDPQQENATFPVLSRIGDEILVLWQGMSPEGYWEIYGRKLSGPKLTE